MQAACPVTAALAIAENLPGATATRPGDVVRARNGMTVEIIDTDAEGRLALADALATLAAEPEERRPSVMIDTATLTGTVVTALGRHYAGFYTSDDTLAAALQDAGKSAEEPVWRLPLTDARDEDLESPIADIRQCAPPMRWAARCPARGPVPEPLPRQENPVGPCGHGRRGAVGRRSAIVSQGCHGLGCPAADGTGARPSAE